MSITTKLFIIGMRNFQDTFEILERSFISDFSICMTVLLAKSRTCLISQTNMHLGFRVLNTPDTNEQILGHFLTVKPSIHTSKAEIVQIYCSILIPIVKKESRVF